MLRDLQKRELLAKQSVFKQEYRQVARQAQTMTKSIADIAWVPAVLPLAFGVFPCVLQPSISCQICQFCGHRLVDRIESVDS